MAASAHGGPRRSRDTRYGGYVGGPDPLAPPVDLAEALDAIGEDVMAGYSPERAMREFLRRGGPTQQGLDDLAARVAAQRQELLSKHNLNGTMAQVRELLDRAVMSERKQLAREMGEDARFAEMQIENLNPSTAAAVSELGDYTWHSSDARVDYEHIKDLLGREMLDQRFAGMKQALEGASEEDKASVNEMLRDLNALLEARRLGEDTEQLFADFMNKHGGHFPENPETIDELLDALAQRAAAAQRMRNSMTQEQRDELDALAQQAFGTPELLESLSQLDDNLRSLRPGENWGGSGDFNGEQGLGLGDGTGALQDLADLDALSEQLSQEYAGASMSDVDLDLLAKSLDGDAAVDAATLAELERALRETGMMQRGSDGALKLSPKAMRQLGKSLLKDVAQRMSGRAGARDLRRAGAAGERSGATREWEFGDTEPWDITRTVLNAHTRAALAAQTEPCQTEPFQTEPGQAGSRRTGIGTQQRGRIHLSLGDVEVQETEARTQAAVALLVDTSFSMAMEGRWVPMKRTALALHQLISTRFRGDALQLISFGRYAEVLDIEHLTAREPRYDKGTNLHHALLLAARHFRKRPSAQPVLLIVTDGEPTAHLEPGGETFFDYPPHPLTLARSVRELDHCARLGTQTTFFRLGSDPGLARFIEAMARRVQGSVVAPELDDLGAAVLGSYLSARTPGWTEQMWGQV
ncbi:MAG: VWA domain-containing protein [Ornithinimicrobium sp.]